MGDFPDSADCLQSGRFTVDVAAAWAPARLQMAREVGPDRRQGGGGGGAERGADGRAEETAGDGGAGEVAAGGQGGDEGGDLGDTGAGGFSNVGLSNDPF